MKDQINEKADFKTPQHPDHRPKYVHLIPMAEIITKAIDMRNPFNQTVTRRWTELVSAFSSEIRVLLDVDVEHISKITAPAITDAIQAFRENKVIVHPGGGGQYGVIEFPDENEQEATITIGPIDTQTCLYDY